MNHAELERELPWYLNATVSSSVRERIERALPGCERCANELVELRALRGALLESEEAASAPSPGLQADVTRGIRTTVDTERRGWLDFASVRRQSLAGFGLLATIGLAVLFVIHPPARGLRTAPAAVDYIRTAPGGARSPTAPRNMAAMQAAAPKLKVNIPRTTAGGADAASASVRALARTGTIGLIVPDVPTALDRVERLADQQFGASTGLQDNAPSVRGGAHTAQVTVSIPDDRFAHTLDALAALGGVTTRSVTTEDLTDSIVDGDARLRNLRHEEADLLRIMDRSGKVADVLSVEEQLASTRDSIEQLDAEQKALRQRVAYATITVDLSDEKTTPVASVGADAQLRETWRAALRAVSACTLIVASLGLYLIAFAPYIFVVAAIAYLAYRWSARHH